MTLRGAQLNVPQPSLSPHASLFWALPEAWDSEQGGNVPLTSHPQTFNTCARRGVLFFEGGTSCWSDPEAIHEMGLSLLWPLRPQIS